MLDQAIADRCAETVRSRPSWPCRAGCADCCRSLSREPEVTRVEWERIREALDALVPADRARVDASLVARRRAGGERPVVCPLLDEERSLCRVYDTRPIECRAHGFYADRDGVLGCVRIAAIAEEDDTVLWGNQDGLRAGLDAIGPRRSLLEWME
jgi:Fe-S-cluster containining protein